MSVPSKPLSGPPEAPSPQLDAVPAELRTLKQWVLWQYQRKDGTGQFTKVPLYQPKDKATGRPLGHLALASAIDSATWATAEEVYALYQAGQGDGSGEPVPRAVCYRDRPTDGIGLVPAGGDLLLLDFDGCVRPDGTIEEWAWFYLLRLATYTEYSPSLSGIRAVLRAPKPWSDRRGSIKILVLQVTGHGAHSTPAVEILHDGRYGTITGCRVQELNPDVRTCPIELRGLYDWLIGQNPQAERHSRRQTEGVALPPSEPVSPAMTDEEVLTLAREGRGRSRASAEKFCALYDRGEVSIAAYNGDDSAADLGLCNILVYYTQRPEQVDRLFRQSKLLRPKWDEMRGPTSTYGALTIGRALAGVESHYQPPAEAAAQQDGNVAAYNPSSYSSIRNTKADRKLPTLDDAALYGPLGEVVERIAPQTEAAVPALVVSLLTMLGNALGRGPHAMVGRGGRHGTNLFSCVVGRTAGGRKGTSADEAEAVMKQVARQWADERIQSGLSSGEGLINAVRDRQVKQGKDQGEIVVDEGVTDKRLLVVEEEFCAPIKLMTREGNTLSARMREAWDGKDMGTLTRNNALRATGPHISVIGHVTRDELLKYLTETEMGDGFANRILWCMSEMSKFLPDGGQLVNIDPIVESLKHAVQHAHTYHTCLIRADAATEFWHGIYQAVLLAERPGLYGAVTARAEAQTLRLSVIYAALDCDTQVRLPHLQAAFAVWCYCQESARRIFGDRTGNSLADRILLMLREAGEDGLLTTVIHEKLGRHQKADRIHGALVQLCELGLAVLDSSESSGFRFRAAPTPE